MSVHTYFLLFRGRGMFIGVEFVRDRRSKEPATEEASIVYKRYQECTLYSFGVKI